MKKGISLIVLSIIFAVLLTNSGSAQREIYGKVLTAEGKAIPNITVSLKGQEIKSTTDNNGSYKIVVPDNIQNIEFETFEGMYIKEVKFLSDTEINVILLTHETPFDRLLNELMNIQIVTASKKKEKVREAPAIVTVITDEMIDNYGVQSLSELMSFVPGFSVADCYFKRHINTARGAKMTLYNDKILMLINGIPAYEASSLEYFLDAVPIIAIERIEIIRGPGSTLYGSNAFSAVINVITKDGKNNRGVSAYVSGGSFNSREVGIAIGNQHKDFSYHLSASMKNNDGYIKEDVVDEFGEVGDIVYEHDNDNILLNLKYKNLSLHSGYMFQKKSEFGGIPAFISGNSNINNGGRYYGRKYFTNLVFENELSEKFTLNLNYRFDWSDRRGNWGTFPAYFFQNQLALIDTTVSPDYMVFSGYINQFGAEMNYKLNDKIHILSGINFESRTTGNLADVFSDLYGKLLLANASRNMPFTDNEYGAYMQMDMRLKNLGIIAGLRASYLFDKNIYITPRAGLVYNLSSSGSLKLLYGEAFRSAAPNEQYFRVPAVIHGPDIIGESLKPERIRSYEFAFDQQIASKGYIRLNFFNNEIIDIISRRRATIEEAALTSDSLSMIYDNVGERAIYGFEFEFLYKFGKNFGLWGNFSYKDGKVDENSTIFHSQTVSYNPMDTTVSLSGGTEEDFIPYMENIIANAGISYHYKNFSIWSSIQFVGEKEGYKISKVSESSGGVTYDYSVNKLSTTDAYQLLNLKLDYQLNQNIKTSLIINNLLDNEYYYPEDVRKNLAVIPGGPGRSIFLKITYCVKRN